MSELGRYRKVFSRLWRNVDFAPLGPDDKLLSIYLLAGPQMNRIGLFYLSLSELAADLANETRKQETAATLSVRVSRVCKAVGWKYDRVASVVFVPSWWTWNPPANINALAGSLKDINEIPTCGLVAEFCQNAATLPDWLQQPFHDRLPRRLRIRFPEAKRNRMPTTEIRELRTENSNREHTRAKSGAVEKPVEKSDDDGRKTAEKDDARRVGSK